MKKGRKENFREVNILAKVAIFNLKCVFQKNELDSF